MMKDSTSQKEKLRLYLILFLIGILSLPLGLKIIEFINYPKIWSGLMVRRLMKFEMKTRK